MARSVKSAIEVTTEGFDGVESYLDTVIEQASKASLTGARKVAQDVAFVAREMSPMNTGSLQDAIIEGPASYSNMVAKATVVIDEHARNDVAGQWVSDYADEAHDEITPVGNWELGILSLTKQEMVPSYDGIGVGGGFMTRALAYCAPDAPSMIAQEIGKVLEKYNR